MVPHRRGDGVLRRQGDTSSLRPLVKADWLRAAKAREESPPCYLLVGKGCLYVDVGDEEEFGVGKEERYTLGYWGCCGDETHIRGREVRQT